MNTQQLESFIQVAENLNFARAAEILNITQSAVSRQINALETELGTKLLHRSTRTVTLTPAGIGFLNDAKEIYTKLQFATAKIRNHEQSNIQILSIGCSSEADMVLLSKVLSKCRKSNPELHPFLRIIPHRSILNLFIHGEIEFLFAFKDDIPMRDGFSYIELARMKICCAVSAFSNIAEQKSICIKDIISEKNIICNSYEIPAKVADIQHHIEHFLTYDMIYYCENLQVMITLIKAGYGLGILPENVSFSSDIVYIPLQETEPISYGIFYKKKANNSISRDFISIVKGMANQI